MNETAQISVGGVDCQSCALTIEKNVISLDGVDSAAVNVIRGDLSISFDPEIISSEKISNKVKSLGYTVGDNDRQISVFKVSGMDCAAEEKLIRNSLGREKGIHKLEFDLMGERLTVEHSLSSHAIIQNISAAGLRAEIEGRDQLDDGKDRIRKRIMLTIISGLFIAAGAILDFTDIFQQALIPLYIAAMLSGGIHMARKGFYALKTLTLDMNFLMTLAVIGAAFIGEWLEGAMVIFLFSIAELLEAGSLNRARNAIRSLMELAPDTARVIRDNGEFETLQIDNIEVGTMISVRPGERIPLDGEVIANYGYVNEAPITGESMPVEKVIGDPVFAGSINGDSALEIRVTRVFSESTISRIIKLVEDARNNKSPSEKFVDKFSRYYTPIVVGLSAAMLIVPTVIFDASFNTWFYRALVLLVVACPCALVISTPVTIVSGLTRAARSGVLIKGGNYLEAMANVDAIVLDKTGTITIGKPEVSEVISLNSLPEDKIFSIAASVESASEHPVANAIIADTDSREISYQKC